MTSIQIWLVLACVAAISTGQLLFKKAGVELAVKGSWLNSSVATYISIAAIIYGSATLLWIYLLQDIDLNKAYMFMALSFVMVPIGSALFFNETITWSQAGGCLLIISGLLLVSKFN